MFFALLCLLISGLLLTSHTPDQYGWMMLIGVGWLAGYLDCRRFSRSDREKDRVMPPDVLQDTPVGDSQIFNS
jgi:hypothetical protein